MVNNMFPCDGYVIKWAYYVAVPTKEFAASIWRPVDEFKFFLLHKQLMPATKVGFNEFTLPKPVFVEKGDFIGIHYPRSAKQGAIGGSTSGRSDTPAAELYEAYSGELYDQLMTPNAEFDMKWLGFQKGQKTFSIQAIMDYTGIEGTVYLLRLPSKLLSLFFHFTLPSNDFVFTHSFFHFITSE